MAEYAGLEIRIGGNTTKLNKALTASTKSAAELQSRIRQVTRAMQFDPTDIKNVETRIKLTGDRMQSMQAKAKLMATSMKQLGDSMVKLGGEGKSVREVASQTDNLSLAAKQADERYAKLTGSLAEIYDAWNMLARSEGKNFARDKLGIDANTAEYLMSASTSMRDFRTELANINKMRAAGLDEYNRDIISPEQLDMLKRFKELNFHAMFKNGLQLGDVVKEAHSLGLAISTDAVDNVRELQETFKDAAEEKQAFDKALQFEQIGTDIQRVNSEIESLSQTVRTLDDSLSETQKRDLFQNIESDARSVDAALDNVEADLKRTEEAMKVDPKNIELAARYMQDLQQKVALSEEKTSLLKKEMQMLAPTGAREATRVHQDLAKWIEETAESARVAKKELSDQQAAVMNLEDAVKTSEQALSNIKKDATIAEMSDNVQSFIKKTEGLAAANKELADAEAKLKESNANLGRETDNYNSAKESAGRYKSEIEALEKELEECQAVMNDIGASDFDKMGAFNRLGEIPGEIDRVESEFRKANREVDKYKESFNAAQEEAKNAATEYENCKVKVNNLDTALSTLKETSEVELFQNPGEQIEKEEKALEGLKAELAEARAEEKRRQAAYNSAEAENNLAKEAKAYDNVEQEIEEARVKILEAQEAMSFKSGKILNPSTLKSIGMTLSATVTPMIYGIGRSMMEASTDIDAAYRNMRKTVDGTDEQFETLRKHAMEFATTHVTSADQILEIEAIGGELGVATENLEAFAEAISNIDVATNLDTEEAADTLGHLSNIMKLSAEDYEGFSNALVRLGNNGASTESEIANIAERIGAMGSIVGMSASDVLAWASSIASTGQKAEAAGTAVSKTMSFFETAVAAAGGTLDTSFESIDAAVREGGDRLTVFASLAGMTAEEFSTEWETGAEDMAATMHDQLEAAKANLQMIADVAHMSAAEFSQAWESDPTKAMKAFIDGLNDVEASGGSADKVLVDLGITSVRQKQAIEGLMQTIGGLDDNLKMSEDAWNGVSDKWGQAGDAANEAAKKAEGFSGQLQIMKNMWHNALAELGEGAAPWLQRFSGMLASLTTMFSSLSIGTKETLVALGGIIAAAGPVLTIVSTFGTSVDNIKSWVNENVTGLSIVTSAYKQFGNEGVKALTGMNYTMSAVKLVAKELGVAVLKSFAFAAAIAAVVALGMALKDLYDRYQDHIAATEGLSNALAGIGVASKDATEKMGGIGKSFGDLVAESDKYESRLADLSRTIDESNTQYGAFAGQMEYYAETIRTLGSKSELTKDEAYKLEAALQSVNEACGTTYAIDEYGNIIDTQTGKIQDNTDTILSNIDARKQQAMFDYYADDYAKATENWAAAQDRVNDLLEEKKRLESEEGHDAFVEDYMTNNLNDRAQAEAVYQEKVKQTNEALAQNQQELSDTQGVMNELEGKMGKAQEELDKATEAIDKAAAAEEEYGKRSETVTADVTGNMKKLSDAVDEVGGDDAGFNAIADGLQAVHAGANELNKVDMSALAGAFDSANGSMEQVIQTLENGGVQMITWNSALEQAPGAAENMSSLTAAAFQSMYNSAGQNLGDTMTLISGLDISMGEIDGKELTFYVGDNGSVTDSTGKVYDLKKDMDKLPKQVVTKVKGDNNDAKKKISETDRALKNTGKTTATPKISANDLASKTISDVKRALNDLDGKVATTYINTVRKDKQATGGMNSRPVIPEHASGFIATGPTLTNQGWIGEDGVEAVANWATGGAVVPLTNKRYMLPIADAIADGMARRMDGIPNGGPQISIVVNGVSGPDEVADAITRRLSMLNL